MSTVINAGRATRLLAAVALAGAFSVASVTVMPAQAGPAAKTDQVKTDQVKTKQTKTKQAVKARTRTHRSASRTAHRNAVRRSHVWVAQESGPRRGYVRGIGEVFIGDGRFGPPGGGAYTLWPTNDPSIGYFPSLWNAQRSGDCVIDDGYGRFSYCGGR